MRNLALAFVPVYLTVFLIFIGLAVFALKAAECQRIGGNFNKPIGTLIFYCERTER